MGTGERRPDAWHRRSGCGCDHFSLGQVRVLVLEGERVEADVVVIKVLDPGTPPKSFRECVLDRSPDGQWRGLGPEQAVLDAEVRAGSHPMVSG